MKAFLSQIFPALLSLLLAVPAAAEELEPADYVALDLAARERTLEGVQDRLLLLELEGDAAAQSEIDQQTRQAVEKLYAEQGTTPASAAAWATRNRDAVQAYLDDHPALQDRYQRIARELKEASNAIRSITGQQ